MNGFDQLPVRMIGIDIIRVKVRIMRRHVEIIVGDRSYALQGAASEEIVSRETLKTNFKYHINQYEIQSK